MSAVRDRGLIFVVRVPLGIMSPIWGQKIDSASEKTMLSVSLDGLRLQRAPSFGTSTSRPESVTEIPAIGAAPPRQRREAPDALLGINRAGGHPQHAHGQLYSTVGTRSIVRAST